MSVKEIICGIMFTTALLFMSGADRNPIWVTLFGVFIPMGIMYLLAKHE